MQHKLVVEVFHAKDRMTAFFNDYIPFVFVVFCFMHCDNYLIFQQIRARDGSISFLIEGKKFIPTKAYRASNKNL